MKLPYLLGACAPLLAACAPQTTPLPVIASLNAVTDPSVGSTSIYSDPMAGYTYRGPADPRDWRDVNREQSEQK